MSYFWRYIAALFLAVLAVASLVFAWLGKVGYGPMPSLVPWVIVAGGVAGGLWLANRKGLLLLKSAKLDQITYLVVLWVALTLLGGMAAPYLKTTIGLDGPSVESPAYEQPAKDGSSSGGWFDRWNPITKVRQLLREVMGFVVRLVRLALGILLSLVGVAAILAGLVLLWAAVQVDLKSGVVFLMGLILLVVSALALKGAGPQAVHVGFGIAAVWVSLALAVNWASLRVSGDITEFHPDAYEIVCALAKEESFSRSTLQERIRDQLPQAASVPQSVALAADAALVRLKEERIIREMADGRYQLMIAKRLRFLDVLLACIALIWLANPTCGVLEIPDNLPLVGNIDEALAAFLLFRIYPKWKADKQAMRRMTVDEQMPDLPVQRIRS